MRGLINSFYIYSHSIWKIRVLWIISIKPSHSLLIHTGLLPSSHKLLHFLEIHKWNVINMSIWLSLQYYSRWKTFLAHTKRKRFMISTIIFYFIWHISIGSTILTLLMRKMLIFTFHSLFCYKIIKTLMLHKLFIFFFLCSSIFLFFFSTMNHLYFFCFWFMLDLFNNSAKTICFLIFYNSFWSFDNSAKTIFNLNFLLFFFFLFLFNWLKFLWWRWQLC